MNKVLFVFPLFLLACGISALPATTNENPTITPDAIKNQKSELVEPLSTPTNSKLMVHYPVRGNWHIRTCAAYTCKLAETPIAYSGETFTVLCVTDGWAQVGAGRWIHTGAFGTLEEMECE